jgi:hypothetical protein
MQTEAFKMDMDFVILLRLGQVKTCREQLSHFLEGRFPPYRFDVGADHAGLIGDGEFCLLPVLSGGLEPGGHHDAMVMRPHPSPQVMREISRAVEEFRAGKAGRPN